MIGAYGAMPISPFGIAFLDSRMPAFGRLGWTSKVPPPAVSRLGLVQPGKFFAQPRRPLGWGVERGVKSRERAWIFARVCILAKRASGFCRAKISSQGKFSRPREAPHPRGLFVVSKKFSFTSLSPKLSSALRGIADLSCSRATRRAGRPPSSCRISSA